MSNNIINRVKPVEVGCVVWVDGYNSKLFKHFNIDDKE